MKEKLRLVKKGLTFLASLVIVFLVLWFLVLGKIRAQQLLSPLLSKVPKNPDDLKEAGKNVLGTAEEAATSENAQKILKEGINFLETSSLVEPIRVLKENLTQKAVETIETIKELPEREVRTIKREVCKQWLEEDVEESTAAGSP